MVSRRALAPVFTNASRSIQKTGASAQRLTKSSVAISYAHSILNLSFEFADQFRFHFVPHRSPIQSQLLASKVVLTQLRVDHGDVML